MMKKLVFCLSAAMSISSMVSASVSVVDEEKMTREGQHQRYLAYQRELINKERAEKQARREEGRRQQAEHQKRKQEEKLEQAELPTGDEYMFSQSDVYMQTFIPFLKKLHAGFRGAIPEVIQPNAVYFVPHRNGLIELRLKGYSTTSQPHVVNFMCKFLEGFQAKESPRTCNFSPDIYFTKDVQIIQNFLENKIRKHIAEYNSEATTNNKKRKLILDSLRSSGDTVQIQEGVIFTKVNPYSHSDFGFNSIMATIALQEYPEMPELNYNNIEACFDLIDSAKLVKVKLDSERHFTMSNFQGVQY